MCTRGRCLQLLLRIHPLERDHVRIHDRLNDWLGVTDDSRLNTSPVTRDQRLGNIPPVTARSPEANAAFTRATLGLSVVYYMERVMVHTFS